MKSPFNANFKQRIILQKIQTENQSNTKNNKKTNRKQKSKKMSFQKKKIIDIIIRQISDYYGSNITYQIKLLFHLLYEKKPQLEIVRLLGKEEQQEQIQVWNRKQRDPLKFEVYDKILEKSKYFEIYLQNTLHVQLTQIEEQISLVSSFAQSDLILKPTDSYYLETHFQETEFFVIEYDMFDFTLREFCQVFNVNQMEIQQLLIEHSVFCQDICEIQLSDKSSFQDTFFVQIFNFNQIRLKLNLIGVDSKITKIGKESKDINFVKQEKEFTSNGEIQLFNESHSMRLLQKMQQLEVYINHLKQNEFEELGQFYVHEVIDRAQLCQRLQVSLPDKFKQHNCTIFKILSEHPQYYRFEPLTIDDHQFTFKVYQSGKHEKQSCVYLQGIKYQSHNDASQLEKAYQQLLVDTSHLSRLSDSERIMMSTQVSKVELIDLENEYYLLIENQDRITCTEKKCIKFKNYLTEIATLISATQIGDQKQLSQYSNCITLAHHFENIIERFYSLFINHGFQITKLNPEYLFVRYTYDEQKDEEIKYEFVVSKLDQKSEFSQELFQIIFMHFEKKFRNQLKENTINFSRDIFKEFFNQISSSSKHEVQQTYEEITKLFQNLKEFYSNLNNYHRKLFPNIIRTTVKDPSFDNLSLFFKIQQSNSLLNKIESIKTVFQILKTQQFISINYNFEKLLTTNDIKVVKKRPVESDSESIQSNAQKKTVQIKRQSSEYSESNNNNSDSHNNSNNNHRSSSESNQSDDSKDSNLEEEENKQSKKKEMLTSDDEEGEIIEQQMNFQKQYSHQLQHNHLVAKEEQQNNYDELRLKELFEQKKKQEFSPPIMMDQRNQLLLDTPAFVELTQASDDQFDDKLNVNSIFPPNFIFRHQENKILSTVGKGNVQKILDFLHTISIEQQSSLLNSITDLIKSPLIEFNTFVSKCDIQTNQIIFWRNGCTQHQFDYSTDELEETVKNTLCFYFKNDDQEIIVSIIPTKHRFITLLCEEPLIGAYFQSVNDFNMTDMIKEAIKYEQLSDIYRNDLEKINYCCEFQEQFDLQLLPLQNQNGLKSLSLCFNLEMHSQKETCLNHNSIIMKNQQLNSLERFIFCLSNNYEIKSVVLSSKEQKQKVMQQAKCLRNLINSMKYLNSFTLQINRNDSSNISLFQQQLRKSIRLVQLQCSQKLIRNYYDHQNGFSPFTSESNLSSDSRSSNSFIDY